MENIIKTSRSEYPRPDFIRQQWRSLNGTWEFAFDDDEQGLEKRYHYGENMPRSILVPFCYQSEKSGVGEINYHKKMWYSRTISVTATELQSTCLLKFGAVDYETNLWVNGNFVGMHQGGNIPFAFDITHSLHPGDNILALLVMDDFECDRPRGKQYWNEQPDRCWYTPVSGIWQNVWLEMTGSSYIEQIKLTPDIDNRLVELELYLNQRESLLIEADIFYKGELKKKVSVSADSAYIRECICLEEEDKIDEIHYWSPEHPNLYEINIRLVKSGVAADEVSSYFGMRKIHIRNGHIFLNNKLFYQRLILDQGYWDESLLTPPSGEALRLDVELTKKMGFNGVRKHQKFEDPRYYYWADVLGLAVWGELPSGYAFNAREIKHLTNEWEAFINQSYNHPCIIVWVPLNESWGVRNILSDKRQQSFAKGLYHLTKALDSTRLISTNDGWEQVAETDILGLHDYAEDGNEIRTRYADLETFLKTGIPNRQALADNQSYEGQPFMLTEFGGLALTAGRTGEWGYNQAAQTEEEFCERLKDMVAAIRENPSIQGFCYTQLTDVMQEVNGLLTTQRIPKVDLIKLAQIFE